MSVAGVFQRCRAIGEKHGVVDVVFLAEFMEERMSENVVLVGSSFVWSNSLVSGSTTAYSQYCSSLSRITVSSTAT
ncbi:hypothetical protein HFX_6387 (plasmid) [Haloferax mediterranei ATCC 33500]|uniref:Uncharacterized protein n=1 Tax=Haloferax mediterranei (strain ATCC 33500 / DSM 1411 / JCM 8866 / NBRC 14739 / NCIMB 2177 / R-4) TaxID=523841 RepID=I3RB97_HALMT|nr:hypothetical protein HFX_6387 [Haloferax mediterranei ATCC 33500]